MVKLSPSTVRQPIVSAFTYNIISRFTRETGSLFISQIAELLSVPPLSSHITDVMMSFFFL
jgi:hypothetical protein